LHNVWLTCFADFNNFKTNILPFSVVISRYQEEICRFGVFLQQFLEHGRL